MFFAALFTLAALAQDALQGNSISGRVVNDRTGLPLRDARVVLQPAKSGSKERVGADTNENGEFQIHDVAPGRYSISAGRDGYLPTSICSMGSVRLPQIFPIGSNESIVGLTFRLRSFAVVAGRVTLESGEAAMNVHVEAYREYRNHLRHGYRLAGNATTNDRGEYRIFGLQAGSYIISATYGQPQQGGDEFRETRALRYATTFYANATKLGEAVAVPLDYGQEVGSIDIVLERVKKITLLGHVIDGLTGDPVGTASLALQRVDAHGTASIPVTVDATFDKNKQFEIRDVVPESYVIWAEGSDAGKALVGHSALNVGQSDIDNLELTIYGDRPGKALLTMLNGDKPQEPVTLRFEPRNERGKVVTAEQPPGDQAFQFSLMGDDRYDLFATNLPNDYYLSQVRVNGIDMLSTGIEGTMASVDHPFEVVIDSRGGRVSGRAFGPDDSLWSRASVALIPDPPAGRVQSYREGAADENGIFLLRGVPPGKYILVAWLDEVPCDYYDPDGLASCRATGMNVEVQQSGEQNVDLKMKALGKR